MTINNRIVTVLIVAILLISLVVVLAVINQKTNRKTKSLNKSFQVSSSSAGFDKSLQNEKNSKIATTSSANLNIPKNLPNGVNVINLEPIKGKNGNASVVTVQDNGSFVIAIEATLSELPNESNYTAWIVKKGSDETLPLGNLKKVESKYILSATLKGKISDYRTLIISQETHDDNVLEVRILEKTL